MTADDSETGHNLMWLVFHVVTRPGTLGSTTKPIFLCLRTFTRANINTVLVTISATQDYCER